MVDIDFLEFVVDSVVEGLAEGDEAGVGLAGGVLESVDEVATHSHPLTDNLGELMICRLHKHLRDPLRLLMIIRDLSHRCRPAQPSHNSQGV